MEEYLKGDARLQEFYTHITIESTFRVFTPLEKNKGVDTNKWTDSLCIYRSNGEAWRLDSSSLDGEKARVDFVNPLGSVVATRESKGSPFVVSGLNSANFGYSRMNSIYKFYNAPTSSFLQVNRFITGRIPYLDHERIEIDQESSEGERLVTITVRGVTKRPDSLPNSQGPPKEKWPHNKYVGRFVLYRDRSWALKEAFAGAADLSAAARVIRCEYEGMEDDVPLLKLVDYTRVIGPESRVTYHELYEITSIRPGAVPMAELRSEALGLNIGEQRANWTFRLLMLFGAILLIGVYFILRRR